MTVQQSWLMRIALLLFLSTTGFDQVPSGRAKPQTAYDLPLEDPSVLRARMEVDKLRVLVENGTGYRAWLEKAELELLDKQDEATITRALFGKDVINVQQAAETVAAAERRLERRKKTLEEQTKQLAAGRDDVDRAQKDVDWAVARGKLVNQVEFMASAEAQLLRRSLETPPDLESKTRAKELRQRAPTEYTTGKTSSTYEQVHFAISGGYQVSATYNGLRREMSPHALGTKNNRRRALFYQFGGESGTGIQADGSPANWRCMAIDRLVDVRVKKGLRHTASDHSKPNTCLDQVDIQVQH